MTRLSCSVTNCVANESHLCCFDSINVGSSCESSVHTKDDTCCESFAEKSTSATNSMSSSTPSMNTQIDCSVHDCQYNKSEKCSADSVSVQDNSASAPCSTRCGTYKTR